MAKDDKPTTPQNIEKPPVDKPDPRIQAPQFDVITEGGPPPDKVKKG
ncbi:MAG: hypothetical protein WC443_12090 [Desulfobaccales bacterium]